MENQPPDELGVDQYRAREALIARSTVVAASAACGAPKRTLFHRLKETKFQKAFRKMQQEVVTQAHADLQGSTADAAGTLRALMRRFGWPTAGGGVKQNGPGYPHVARPWPARGPGDTRCPA